MAGDLDDYKIVRQLRNAPLGSANAKGDSKTISLGRVPVEVNRTHLVTTKDVLNIRRAYGLKRLEKHPDDTTSVALLIEELKETAEENSSIILHKFPGQPHVGVSDE